jgi:hypothetical protein
MPVASLDVQLPCRSLSPLHKPLRKWLAHDPEMRQRLTIILESALDTSSLRRKAHDTHEERLSR